MPRVQISIKLDEDVLRRVDEAAEVLEYTRTKFIERAVKRALDNLDSIFEEMEEDSHLTAMALDFLASKKSFMKGVGRLMASEMTPEQLEEGLDSYPKLRAEADRRKAAKKKGGKR